jgi:hypothetical protein
MKYWIIRIPEPTPLGLTLFFAIVLAIVCAFFVNKSLGGLVETVFTLRIHFLGLAIAYHRETARFGKSPLRPLRHRRLHLAAASCGARVCAAFCERRSVLFALWFAPPGVPKPSVRLVCAFAPQNAPAATVLLLTQRFDVRVSGQARSLLSGGEMP